MSDELGPELASHFMQLIGILCWAVELGQINIFFKVSSLSQYQVNPRVGHLEAAYHIFAYLTRHPNRGQIAYDLKSPDIDESLTTMLIGWISMVKKRNCQQICLSLMGIR